MLAPHPHLEVGWTTTRLAPVSYVVTRSSNSCGSWRTPSLITVTMLRVALMSTSEAPSTTSTSAIFPCGMPDDRFQERFEEYCQSLTNLSPITARLTKRVVRRATALADGEAHFRYDLQNTLKAFGSEDGREARQTFMDKRPPAFQGR